MLGWILLGLATAAVCLVVISGIVNKSRIKEKIIERKFGSAIITEIDKCTNVVKLESLYSNDTIEIQGDKLDDSLEKYDVIRV